MKIKHLSKKKLKEKAWDLFSVFIRTKYADQDGLVECVTCGKSSHWKQLQAGHFVDGRNNSVLFNERLVHPQCKRCNVFLKGNKVKYVLFMKKTYGYTDQEIEYLDNLKFQTKDLSVQDLLDIVELYKFSGK